MFKIFKQNISRSPYQSIAAILVVSLSFFLISIFFLLGVGSQKILQFFETRPQVTAFLKDEAKLQEVELLKAKIESSFDIRSVNYITKDDALKVYKEQNKDKPLLLEMVTAKILPASLEISTKDLSSLKKVAQSLKKENIVEDVVYQEDIITALSNWVRILRKAGIAIAGFLLLISFATILVVLGMKISQRKADIEIYKLLGASSWYIRKPIYLEGIFLGTISALVSWGLSLLTVNYFSSYITSFLSGIPLLTPFPIEFFLLQLGGMLAVGAVIGFLGSFLAASRFMSQVR